MVERPHRVREVAGGRGRSREVAGSILDRVIQKAVKMEIMAALLGEQGCGVSIKTNGPVVLINVHRKRRDITGGKK